jgi:hypothetical protein
VLTSLLEHRDAHTKRDFELVAAGARIEKGILLLDELHVLNLHLVVNSVAHGGGRLPRFSWQHVPGGAGGPQAFRLDQ